MKKLLDLPVLRAKDSLVAFDRLAGLARPDPPAQESFSSVQGEGAERSFRCSRRIWYSGDPPFCQERSRGSLLPLWLVRADVLAWTEMFSICPNVEKRLRAREGTFYRFALNQSTNFSSNRQRERFGDTCYLDVIMFCG